MFQPPFVSWSAHLSLRGSICPNGQCPSRRNVHGPPKPPPMRSRSTCEDQLRPAIDAVGATLPPRRRVFGLAAPLRAHPRVHDAATRRAMAHGGLRASMIQVLTWVVLHGFPRSVAVRSSTGGITGPASRSAHPPHAALPAPRPRSARVPRRRCPPGFVPSPDSRARAARGSRRAVAIAAGTGRLALDGSASTFSLTPIDHQSWRTRAGRATAQPWTRAGETHP